MLLKLIDCTENLFCSRAYDLLITLASEINLVVNFQVRRALDTWPVPRQTCVDISLAYVDGELVECLLLTLSEFVQNEVGVLGPDPLEAALTKTEERVPFALF